MNFMEQQFSTFGAVIGLVIAIFLIIKKVQPAYSLILGAVLGGIIGGGGFAATVSSMVSGASSMMPPVLRILTSGVLAGALIKTGAAEKIAETVVKTLGERHATTAVAVATMIICSVGVFIDIAVITAAPIALAIGKEAKLSKGVVLLAMIGGGKAGNIISPNPNTISVTEAFSLELTDVMAANIIPACFALCMTVVLAKILAKKAGEAITESDPETSEGKKLPSFATAIAGPLVVIALLSLRPLAGISVDPLIALPIGGIVCVLAINKGKGIIEYAEYGLSKVAGVSILLIGTGTIAGIIKASALQGDVIYLLNRFDMPDFLLAPIAGILMAGATASTTAGAAVASQTFAEAIVTAGIPALSAAAMIHAGATVVDSLPHGSFFHATGGAVGMNIKNRMKLIPYEAVIGLTSTIAAVCLYLA